MEDTDQTRHWSHVLKSSDDVIHNQGEKEYFTDYVSAPVKMSLLPNNSVLTNSLTSPSMGSTKRGSVSAMNMVPMESQSRFNANHETLQNIPSINSLYHPSIRNMGSFPEDLWRSSDTRKLSAMILIYCQRLQVDPPDVPRPIGCARIFQFVDTQGFSDPAVSGNQIAEALTSGFTQLRNDIPFNVLTDPTKTSILQTAKDTRKAFHSDKDRLLQYYSGHGVPKPTRNGEVWVYDQAYTQYVPLSLKETAMALAAPLPLLYVHDGPAAGIAVDAWKLLCANQPTFNVLVLASSDTEDMALDPRYPVDVFTCCLLYPVRVALLHHYNSRYPLRTPGDTIHTPRGSSAAHAAVTQGFHVPPVSVLDLDRQGDLEAKLRATSSAAAPFVHIEWQLLCILDAIAWSTLPPALFQSVFRKDPTVATMFRNFLLAQRVLRSIGNNPVSVPALPDFTKHFLWQRWDTILAELFTKLSLFLCKCPVPPGINFFQLQFTALRQALTEPDQKRPPLELPMLVQILLHPSSFRTTALQLLCKYIDMCTGNVVVALTTGVLPYLRKLLEFSDDGGIEGSSKLRNALIFLNAKIMRVDCTHAAKTGNKKTFQIAIKHLAQQRPEGIPYPVALPVGVKPLNQSSYAEEEEIVCIENPLSESSNTGAFQANLKPLHTLPLHAHGTFDALPRVSIMQDHAPHLSSREAAAAISLGENKTDSETALFRLLTDETNVAFKALSKQENDANSRYSGNYGLEDVPMPRLDSALVQQAAVLCMLIQFAQISEPVRVALLLTSATVPHRTKEYSMTLQHMDGSEQTTQVSLQSCDITTFHALQNHVLLPRQAIPVSLLSLPYSNTLLRAVKKLNTSQLFFTDNIDFTPRYLSSPTPIQAADMSQFNLDASPYAQPFEPLSSPTPLDPYSSSPVEQQISTTTPDQTNAHTQSSTLPLLEVLGKYLTSAHSEIRKLACVLLGTLAENSYGSQNCLLLSNIHIVLISMLNPYFTIDRLEGGVLPLLLPKLHAYQSALPQQFPPQPQQPPPPPAETSTTLPLVRNFRLLGNVEESPEVRTAAAYALQCMLTQFHAPPVQPIPPASLQTPTASVGGSSTRKNKTGPATPHKKKEKKPVTAPVVPEPERHHELLVIAYCLSFSAYDACSAVRQEVAIGLGHIAYELQDVFVKCAQESSNVRKNTATSGTIPITAAPETDDDHAIPLRAPRSEEFFARAIWSVLLHQTRDGSVTVAYIAENICTYIKSQFTAAKESEIALQSATASPVALRLDTSAGLKQFDRLKLQDRRRAAMKSTPSTLLTSSSNPALQTSPQVSLQIQTMNLPAIPAHKDRTQDRLWNSCESSTPTNALQMLKSSWLDAALNTHDLCQLGTLPSNVSIATYTGNTNKKHSLYAMRSRFLDTPNAAYTYHLQCIKRDHMYAFAHEVAPVMVASLSNNNSSTHKTHCGKAHVHVCSGDYEVMELQGDSVFPSLMNQACLYSFGRNIGTVISKHSLMCKARIRLWITVLHNAVVKSYANSPIHLHTLLQPAEIGQETYNLHGSEMFLVGLGSVVPEILACVAAITQLLYLASKCAGNAASLEASVQHHRNYLLSFRIHGNDGVARLYNSNAALLQHAYDVYCIINAQDHYGVQVTTNQVPCQFQTSRPESITDALITMSQQNREPVPSSLSCKLSCKEQSECVRCASVDILNADGIPVIVIVDRAQEHSDRCKVAVADLQGTSDDDIEQDQDQSSFYPEKQGHKLCMGTDRLCSRCESSEELIELLSTQASCACLCVCDCSCNSNISTIPNSYTSLEEASAVVEFSIDHRNSYDFACCLSRMHDYFPNETRALYEHPALLAYGDPTSMFARNPVLSSTLANFLSNELIQESGILINTNEQQQDQIPPQWEDRQVRKIVPRKSRIVSVHKTLSQTVSSIWRKDRGMLISSQITKWMQSCYGDGTSNISSNQDPTQTSIVHHALENTFKRFIHEQCTGFTLLPRPVTPRLVVFKTGLARRTPRIPQEIMWSHKTNNGISTRDIEKMTKVHAITTSSMLAMKKRHPAEYTFSQNQPAVEEMDLKPMFVEATQLAYSSKMKDVSSVYLHPFDSIVVLGGDQGLIQICDYSNSFIRTPGAQPEKPKWVDIYVRTNTPVVYVSGMNESSDSSTILAATDDRNVHVIRKAPVATSSTATPGSNAQYETVASFLAHPSVKSSATGSPGGAAESYSGNVCRRSLAATTTGTPGVDRNWDYLVPIVQRSRSLQKPIILNGNMADSLTGASALEQLRATQDQSDPWNLYGRWVYSQLTGQLQLQSHTHDLPRAMHADTFNVTLDSTKLKYVPSNDMSHLFPISSPRLSSNNLTKAQSLSGFSLPSPAMRPLTGETKSIHIPNSSNNASTASNVTTSTSNNKHHNDKNITDVVASRNMNIVAGSTSSKPTGMEVFIQQITAANHNQMSGIDMLLPPGSQTPDEAVMSAVPRESVIPNSRLQCHWSKDSGYLVASVDFTKVWDMERLQCVTDLPLFPFTETDKGCAFTYTQNATVYSTTLTASASGNVVFNGLNNGYVSAVDTRIRPKHSLLTCFSTHTDPVVHASCMPSMHEYDLFTVGESGVCNVLDARVLFQTTDLPYNTIPAAPKNIYTNDEWYEDYTNVCEPFTPTEPLSRCYFRKTHTVKPLVRTNKYEPQIVSDEIFPVTSAAVHPITKWVATGSTASFVDIFHINGSSIQTVKYHASFMSQRIEPVKSLLFHPLKPYLFSLASSYLTVYVANKYPIVSPMASNS